MKLDLHSQGELGGGKKNSSKAQKWKSTGPGRVTSSPGLQGCMLRRSTEEYGSTGRLGFMWGWMGAGGAGAVRPVERHLKSSG